MLEDAARQEVLEDASQGYVNDPHERVLILDDMCEVFDPGNAPVDLVVDTSREVSAQNVVSGGLDVEDDLQGYGWREGCRVREYELNTNAKKKDIESSLEV